MLLGALGVSSLGNMLTGRGVNRVGIIRARYGSKESLKNKNF